MNKYLLQRILELLRERGCVVTYLGVSDYLFQQSNGLYIVYNYYFTVDDVDRIEISKDGKVTIY